MKKTYDGALINKYSSIIKGYFPDIVPEHITLFQDGYDHDVLLVNNSTAFRFPRTKDHGKKDRVENTFLPEFAKISPILVQDMESHNDVMLGITYQMYRFIPGIPLTKEFAQSLPEQELVRIAEEMGNFLTTLHSFPIEKARSIGMDELDPKGYWKYFEDLYEKINVVTSSFLSKEENHWMEIQVRDYIIVTKGKLYDVKVTHHDLLAEHIIVDKETHSLNGVIDFSLRIADPARDFEFFDRYGDLFLQTVYKNYLPIDDFFDMRRKFYAGHVPVINLYESIERNDDKMTNIYLMELKQYIGVSGQM